ncbi:MAG: hypothetical protein RL701_2917, partial [Pseudomonadota bacterium]
SYDKAAGYTWASGASLSLDAERLDARSNDSASAWCAGRDSYGPELGTPGRSNPACDPLASDAGVQPDRPEPPEAEPGSY